MKLDDLAEVVRVRRMCATGEAARIRTNARLTVRELAGAMGVAFGTLQKWESGERQPGAELALRYGRSLDLIAKVSGGQSS